MKGRRKRLWILFGFLALDGKDTVMVSERAKAPGMAAFLEFVRAENGDKRFILVVLDNVRGLVVSLVWEKAKMFGVTGVFLWFYSSDFMSIEFGWKDVKRELSVYFNFGGAFCLVKEIVLCLFS